MPKHLAVRNNIAVNGVVVSVKWEVWVHGLHPAHGVSIVDTATSPTKVAAIIVDTAVADIMADAAIIVDMATEVTVSAIKAECLPGAHPKDEDSE